MSSNKSGVWTNAWLQSLTSSLTSQVLAPVNNCWIQLKSPKRMQEISTQISWHLFSGYSCKTCRRVAFRVSPLADISYGSFMIHVLCSATGIFRHFSWFPVRPWILCTPPSHLPLGLWTSLPFPTGISKLNKTPAASSRSVNSLLFIFHMATANNSSSQVSQLQLLVPHIRSTWWRPRSQSSCCSYFFLVYDELWCFCVCGARPHLERSSPTQPLPTLPVTLQCPLISMD